LSWSLNAKDLELSVNKKEFKMLLKTPKVVSIRQSFCLKTFQGSLRCKVFQLSPTSKTRQYKYREL